MRHRQGLQESSRSLMRWLVLVTNWAGVDVTSGVFIVAHQNRCWMKSFVLWMLG